MAHINNPTRAENFLTITMIDSSPNLARQLPIEFAKKFHAIPIASDLMSVTVAMANPDNPAAREAIRSAVRLPVTIVKSELEAIDCLIEKCYSAAPPIALNILDWVQEAAVSPAHEVYLTYLAKALNARLFRRVQADDKRGRTASLGENIKRLNTDLLICSSPSGSCLEKLVGIPPAKIFLQHYPISILALNIPRKPIQQILLVLQDDPVDSSAVDWAVRLATACQASLTILPVVPSAPPIYSGLQNDLPELLNSNCRLGRHLRLIARRLVSWEVAGTFKLRDEPPEWQIRSEITEGEFDLIIIGAAPQKPAQNLIQLDLVSALLGWTPIPVLLAQTYPQGK